MPVTVIIPIIIASVLLSLLIAFLIAIFWIMRKAVFVSHFNPPQSIDNLTFKKMQCNSIPYIIENGVPYKGIIESKECVKESLNKDVKFSLDNELCSPQGIKGDYVSINLPHCYNMIDSDLRDYKGDVWYEREFDIIEDDKRPIKRLVFMGSFIKTSVYIDGNLIGENKEGYLPFSYDISELSVGKHKLVVKVNNVTTTETLPLTLFEGHGPGWHHFSGIHKDVYIEYLPPVNVFKLSCIPRFNGKWSVDVSFLLERNMDKEKLKCTIEIIDKKKVIASKNVDISFDKNEKVEGEKISFEIENPLLWSEENPYLYTAVIKTEFEEASVKFGIREVSWDKGKISINGKTTFIRGVCRHEDNGKKGMATDYDFIKKELELIEELNGNFVRLAHYPHSVVTMDLTDEMGLYAWSEVPFYQAGHAITHDTFGKDAGKVSLKGFSIKKFIENIKKTALARDENLLILAAQSLLKLVERDINRPSIITWGVGNEIWSVNDAAGKGLLWLKEVVEEFDNSRAINYASMNTPVLTKPFESSFKYMDWACINEYYGWYYGKPEQSKPLAEGIYKKFPNKPFVVTETGSDTVIGLRDETRPVINKLSEDYQVYFLEEQWKGLHAAPSFSGLCIWVLKDFPCPEYGKDNPIPYYNMKGLVDKDMNKKLSFHKIKELYGKKKEEMK